MDIIPMGKEIYLDKQKWRITSVMFIGERYYILISDEDVVSLIPATVLENKLKSNNG